MNEQLDQLKVDLIEKKDWLNRELKKSYRSARKHVRENPEKGLFIALSSGLILGYLIKKAIGSNSK